LTFRAILHRRAIGESAFEEEYKPEAGTPSEKNKGAGTLRILQHFPARDAQL